MPMYNLIQYSDSYLKTSGSSILYYRDQPPLDNGDAIFNFADNNTGLQYFVTTG